ncbi:hypothetical protein Agub_g7259, partial [Astrephomene gubernaculifera]
GEGKEETGEEGRQCLMGGSEGAAAECGAKEDEDGDSSSSAGGGGSSGGGGAAATSRPPPHAPATSGEEASPEGGGEAGAGWAIMRDVSHPESDLDVGVQLSDGDGTVPLLSLGLMCRGGWRPGSRLNPGGMRVVTREFKHRSGSLLQGARGGPASAAHVEILGNEGVLADVIR